MLQELQNYFKSGATLPYSFRQESLSKLEKMVKENSTQICEALYKDLHKPEQESILSEIVFLLEEIKFAKKNLKNWMKPDTFSTPLTLMPAKSSVHFQPLGVVLIIAPWNYPFQLALAPLVAALAAGNCAVLKPSELTPHTSKLIFQLISRTYSPDYVKVIEGGVQETTSLLEQKFDHIFFTGSTPVGRIVMQAAVKNLTPVTLELGGKSPVIVCEDADLDLCARRLVWAKFYNAGQTCVAPDYVFIHESLKDEFIKKLIKEIKNQFGQEAQKSQDFSRIVNPKNWSRVLDLIDPSTLIYGGSSDQETLYIEPTLLYPVQWDSLVMKDEIFGPLLPILTFSDFSKLIQQINDRPRPLSAYLFSSSPKKHTEFIEKLHFGGGCINDLLIHLGHPELPFGGLGESGMGSYHGVTGFKTMSHAKSIMRRYGIFDFSARYAPYESKTLNLIKKLFGLK